ncbi:glutathione degradosome [Metschnikowia bicuspidata var. bicuspidata NRRL YB-4993]|uniref:Glutathione degradosome n=1 Tax=Metschnikowia bicuspidata var. bicuspidata NRRL YB-4993 TaxID=869754 RepID=A0A1A0HKB2_9ASCO|nr:glutathione degradosome [Metschnikowia bicuspidata var. bicuspidata NRRL YB-4993]OBA24460.1 glutathione degradosome [Metschnikowia bicuspidata var. bicuspidata NRRL YB-4993]
MLAHISETHGEIANNIHEGEAGPIPSRPRLPINSTTNSTPNRTPSLSKLPISRAEEDHIETELADHAQVFDVEAQESRLQEVLPMVHKWTHTHSILSVVAAPSKDLILCGTQDSKILIFEISTFSLKHVMNCGHRSYGASVLCMTIDPEENFLFTAGSDSLVKVWDLSPFDDKSATMFDINCTHLVYSSVDIGDIFSISWSQCLLTLFIGAQNASILWCKLDFTSVDKLPHLRFDKFFDSKGPGGSINLTQSKHQLLRTSGNSGTKSPALIEIGGENIINFAHNGYVYCMEFLSQQNAPEFCDLHKNEFDMFLVSCGGDGVIKVWGITINEDGLLSMKVKSSLENEDSILSMHVKDSSIYVGLGNSSINAWDLTTFQLTRSFLFVCGDDKSKCDEVLSLCIYNDCIYKATNEGGLCKFALKQDSHESFEEERIAKDCLIKLDLQGFLRQRFVEVEKSSVFAVLTFEHCGSTFLLSGGSGSLCLWNITNVGMADSSTLVAESPPDANLIGSIETSNNHLLNSLKEVVTYKTISKYPSLYLEESRHCANVLGRLLMRLGAADTKLLPVTDCNPIVYANFKRDKTEMSDEIPMRVLWYGHYDVVDAIEAKDFWETDPFKLSAKDGNLYARGVSDNKGPVLAAIYAVAELKRRKKLSTDVVFLIEGEEETGSIGFQDAVITHKDMIGHIDWVMLSNSYWLDDDTPCLNYGLRGVINATISVESEKPDRHSGVDGGVSKEPTMDLIQLVGQLSCQQTNKIKIPGFYENLIPIDEAELSRLDKIKQYARRNNIPEADLDTLLAKWRNPSLTVHRVDVSGPKNNTVIPQRAKASISIRVVPGQDLVEIKRELVSFLQEKFNMLRSENKILVDFFHEAEPWLGDPDNLVYQILYQKMKKNWGVSFPDPLFIREGGSIPSIRFLEKAFDAPAAQIPCGQASDNAHLKDEKLRVVNLLKLKDILQDTFEELGLRKLEIPK